MKRLSYDEMHWLCFDWQRPFQLETVTDLLIHLASHTPNIQIALEARGYQGRVRYYLGVDRKFTRIITDVMKAHGDIRFAKLPQGARRPVAVCGQLKVSKPILSLKTDMTEVVTRAGLAALIQAKGEDQVVLQVILGSAHSPSPLPQSLPDPHASWAKVLFGDVEQASAESRNVVREKISQPGFSAIVRLGASGTPAAARGHILSLLSALKTLRSAGVSIQAIEEKPDKLNLAHIPWHFPLRLSVKELANFLLFPIGEADLPGVAGLHPKRILPPKWYRNPFPIHDRTFAISLDKQHKLSISPKDSLEHTAILGPTGSGKSVLMQHLILSDIYAGRGVLVIDPKSDLVSNILSRIPKHREEDVVIIDPSAKGSVVGVNPLAYKNNSNPGLIADTVLAVFKEIFKDSWGVYSQDVLSVALHTLAKIGGSSLLWLVPLLNNENFRQKVATNIKDKVGLEPFWEMFQSLKDSERRLMIAPIQNKLRQFLLRPGLRNALGQSAPKFDLNELFTKNKIVLVPLNKGQIGADSAKLLGSLIVGLTWSMALGRANIPEEKRKIVGIYIDELQDYTSSISADFSDALAQARGLGVGFTVAHQYIGQLPPEIRAGIDANCRNKICFGLGASDAKAMAAMAPELTLEDFMALPRYHVYTSFQNEGRNTGWVSGQTLPMTRILRDQNELRRMAAARYGRPGMEVEREYMELLASCRPEYKPEIANAPVGRRVKP